MTNTIRNNEIGQLHVAWVTIAMDCMRARELRDSRVNNWPLGMGSYLYTTLKPPGYIIDRVDVTDL